MARGPREAYYARAECFGAYSAFRHRAAVSTAGFDDEKMHAYTDTVSAIA